MPFSLAERVSGISYAIREFVPLALELERKGVKVIYLNIGDPLKYDFDTPDSVKEALYKAVVEGYNYYSLSEGDYELREAITKRERKVNGVSISPEDVIITQGVSEAINFTFAISVNAGDEVLLPGPSYPLYPVMVHIYGGKPVFYKCDEDSAWAPDVDDVRRKISERTKAIVVINPNNPTGAVYDKNVIKELLDIAAEHDVLVISDEIYDRIVFEGEFVSVASLAKDVTAIIFNGFSKAYLMTGWRLGYLYVMSPREEVKEQMLNALRNMARTRLCASTPVQRAAIVALEEVDKYILKLVGKLKERRDYAYKRLSEIPGIRVVKPRGAFYIFPRIPKSKTWRDDREFVLKLLKEEHVLVVHGSGFGKYGDLHFRSVLLPPINVLEKAFDRIEHFIVKYSK